LAHRSIVTEIYLRANNEAGDARAMMVDFGKPLLADVLE
jgi:hypothetical protein